jgi:hypothetical protein
MDQSLGFSIQTLLDIGLRAKQEAMEHSRTTILHAQHATEFVIYAIFIDVDRQGQHCEAEPKDALD